VVLRAQVGDWQAGTERTAVSIYGCFLHTDPGGSVWLVQEVTTRLPDPLDGAGVAVASTADLEGGLRVPRPPTTSMRSAPSGRTCSTGQTNTRTDSTGTPPT
jgi:hypothetical protein